MSPAISSRARSRLLPYLVLAAILLIGAVLRLLYLQEIRQEPDFFFPAIDASYHDYWARGIVTGNWAVPGGREDPLIYRYPFYRPPLYAYFLAALYRLFGIDYLPPRLFQMAIGLGAVWLAFLIGRKWFGLVAGLIWSGLMAVYWIFIYYEGELVGESLSVFLGLPLLWVVAEAGEGRGWTKGLIAGVLFGLYALLRPNVLIFFPAAAVWIVWARRRRPATAASARGGWITAAAAALGTALAIAPATIRNYVVSGEFVPIATNVGITVAVANNELTDGTTHIIPGIGDIGEPFEYPRIVRQLERDLGRSLTHQAAANYLVGRGVAFARDYPGKFLKLLGRKALLFWGPYEIRNLKETHYARLNSPVLRSIPLNFPLVFALGVLGAALFFMGWWGKEKRRSLAPLAGTIARTARWDDRSPSTGAGSLGRRTMAEGQSDHSLLPTPYFRSSQRQFEIAVLLALFISVYFLSMVPFAAADRYRIPLIPFLLLFGALSIERLAEFARGREWGKLALGAASGAALFGLFSLNPTGYRPAPEKWHYDRALAFSDMQDWENAISEYQAAIKNQPQFLRAYNNLGNIYALRNQYDEAARYYALVLKLDPNLAQVHSNLGNVFYKQGKVEEAIVYFRQALRIRPDLVEAWNNLGVALQKQGRLEEAVDAYRKALIYRPQDTSPLVNLGNLFIRLGRFDEAIISLESALKGNPDFAPARRSLESARRLREEQKKIRIKP